jgi:hypothetical protein
VVLTLAIFRAGHERCYSMRNVLCPMGYKRRIISSAMHIRSVKMHSTVVLLAGAAYLNIYSLVTDKVLPGWDGLLGCLPTNGTEGQETDRCTLPSIERRTGSFISTVCLRTGRDYRTIVFKRCQNEVQILITIEMFSAVNV